MNRLDSPFDQIPETYRAQYRSRRAGEVFVIRVNPRVIEEAGPSLEGLAQAIAFLAEHKVHSVLVHDAYKKWAEIESQPINKALAIEYIQKTQALSQTIHQALESALGSENVGILRPHCIKGTSFEHDHKGSPSTIANSLRQQVQAKSALIVGSTGISEADYQKPLLFNSNNLAARLVEKLGHQAHKLFIQGTTPGVLDENQRTIPFLDSSTLKPSDNLYQGMATKMAMAKRIAETQGIPVHLFSNKDWAGIVRESFLPDGSPNTCTMIAKALPQEQFITVKDPGDPLVDQIATVLQHTPNILARHVDHIAESIENWILLVHDKIIKGVCEAIPYPEYSCWELGAFSVPDFLRKREVGERVFNQFQQQQIGNKVFTEFENRRREAGIEHGIAVVKNDNPQAIKFFQNLPRSETVSFPSWFPSKREQTGRTFFRWS